MRALAQWLGGIWTRAFFSPEYALNLASARVIFAAHAIWLLLSRDIPAVSGFPGEFWRFVNRTDLWRFVIVPGHPGVEYAVQWIAVAALICAVLGVVPRLACFIAGALLFHLGGLQTIYWTTNPFQRDFTIDVLALFTLSFSRCGDALRLGGSPPREPSADYSWPLRLVQLHLALAYFFSGASKLIRVGIGWLDPENLRTWFLFFAQEDQVNRLSPVFTTLGPWIADHWLLCFIAGLFGVLANLCFIAVPFSRYARRILVPDAAFFHLMVLLTLNIFWNNVVQLLVYVNWQWLVSALRRKPLPIPEAGHVRT